MLFYGGMNLELFIGFQLPVNVFPDLAIAASLPAYLAKQEDVKMLEYTLALNCLISELILSYHMQSKKR